MEHTGADEIGRARHDAAIAIARTILEIISPCLRPEEYRDAFDEFYQAVSAGLEAYEAMRAASRRPISGPSPN